MSDETPPPATPRRRYLPLLHRVAASNAILLVLAVGVTIAVLDPTRVSSFRVDAEIVLLVVVLAVAVAVNVYVVRRIVAPVHALTALARRVDLTGDGERMPAPTANSEAGELALTFNEMLDRLEAERRDATGRVLAGQEAERLRIAQELHDQIGQELTAVLLSLARVETRAHAELKGDVIEVQEAVRGSLEGVRQIAIELRPEALDDLGLESALAVLCERFSEHTGLRITEHVDAELPMLAPEIELVVYRVAQEALTNVARHSGADAAELDLEHGGGLLTLTVSDRGRGLPADYMAGTGMRGMQERATLLGAHLTIGPESTVGGCRVRLAVALEEQR
ncbi:MAG: HAMP domain-containing sensor histidine kinase [Solirubrobacteraceae bacterium]